MANLRQASPSSARTKLRCHERFSVVHAIVNINQHLFFVLIQLQRLIIEKIAYRLSFACLIYQTHAYSTDIRTMKLSQAAGRSCGSRDRSPSSFTPRFLLQPHACPFSMKGERCHSMNVPLVPVAPLQDLGRCAAMALHVKRGGNAALPSRCRKSSPAR